MKAVADFALAIVLLAGATASVESFLAPQSSSSTVVGLQLPRTSSVALSAGLIPPKSVDEMLSHDGETASLYDEHVQKTYG